MVVSSEGSGTNVGREDRLVRAGVSLSLFLMGMFALVGSARVSLVIIGFALLAAYFAGTAITGWDPMYARQGVDTHRGDAADQHLDLTSALDGADESWGSSLLGR